MTTIADVQEQLQHKLQEPLKELKLLTHGFSAHVRLYAKSRKKKRTISFDGNWHPETDTIEIRFEPEKEQPVKPKLRQAERLVNPSLSPNISPKAITDLIHALDHAESRPGFNFVALKWFRDTVLASGGFAWANTETSRKSILSDAIERRLVLTSTVPNPKSPQFPVTAIRLNRLMPEVIAALGAREGGLPEFRPVPIRGESLSSTVLRDRR